MTSRMDSSRRTVTARVIRALGLVSLVVCAGMVTTAGLTYSHTRAWIAGATRAEGTVVKVEPSESDDGTMYSTTVRFTDAGGGEHEVRSRTQQSPAPFEVGEKAEVLYPPGRPGEAVINGFGELWLLPLVFGLGAFGPLTGGLFFVFVLPSLIRRGMTVPRWARPRPSRVWFAVRMVIMAAALVCGGLSFLSPETAQGEDFPLWFLGVGAVLVALLTPFMLSLLIGVCALLSGFSNKWDRPTHSSPPFDFNNPLLFFHFAGYLAVAGGLGMVLTSFQGGLMQFVQGAGTLLGGLGVLAGVHISMRLCRSKMAEEGDQAAGGGNAPAVPEDPA